MHECHWSQGRLAGRTARERESGTARYGHPPDRGELHEQIVRVLSIDERAAVQRLANLKDICIACFTGGRGIEAEHAVQGELRCADLASCHAHPPVRRLEFGIAARSALVI